MHIEAFREQKARTRDRGKRRILEATDSLYFEYEGDRRVLAAVTYQTVPTDPEIFDGKDTEELMKMANRAWRMTSFIISFITQIAMGGPAVLPPSVVPEEERGKRVFGIEAQSASE